jgi:hypothetical protein
MAKKKKEEKKTEACPSHKLIGKKIRFHFFSIPLFRDSPQTALSSFSFLWKASFGLIFPNESLTERQCALTIRELPC